MSAKPDATAAGRVYRGASLDARRTERREKLVRAGIEVFGTTGFQTATVRQVCAVAGLTERYFYESFDNLHALFVASYDDQLERLRQTLVQALSAAPRQPREMAQALVQAYFGIVQREPRLARILLIEVYGTNQDMGRLYQRGVVDFAEFFRAVIEANVAVDKNRGPDVGLLATAIVGAAIHLGTGWFLSDYRESKDTMVESFYTIIESVLARLERKSAAQVRNSIQRQGAP